MKRTIEHNGMIFYFKSYFADGAYYETADGSFYVLTDAAGNVDFFSKSALESRNRENVINLEFDPTADKNRIKEKS